MATPPKRSCPSPATSSEGTHIKKISIEGNIAAGKSTFVNILKQVCEDWEVVPEPVARWCNVQSTQNEFEEESIYFEHELPGSVQGSLLGLELRKGFKQKIFHALKVCKIKDLHIFTRHLFGSEITEKADEASLTH